MAASPDTLLQKAKVGLLLHQPFFATFLLTVKTEYSQAVQTVSLSPTKLVINPNWLSETSILDVKRHLLLAALHLSLRHVQRRKNRNHRTWNAACEYASTPLILDSGFTLPDPWLYDVQYSLMDAETIYLLLEKAEQNARQNSVNNPSQNQNSTEPEGGSEDKSESESEDKSESGPEDKSESGSENESKNEPITPPAGGVQFNTDPYDESSSTEASISDATVSIALTIAKARGNLPNGFLRRIEKIEKANQDWREILWNRFDKRSRDDYSMRRPNRRFIDEPFYLPSLDAQTLPEIALIIDTSGSINQPDLDMFLAEINSILTTFSPPKVHYIACDTKVHLYQEFTSYPLDLTFPGGEGTDLREPYRYMRKNGINPRLVLHWTDMFSIRWPTAQDTDADILWCATHRGYADDYKPIGELVPLWKNP